MSVVLVKVKWNKQQFDDVELDLSGDVLQFKTQLYSLTGVPVDRQKLMAKGGWMGTLKDEQDLSGLQIKPGQLIMLMGTADVMKAPAAPVTFVEDMSAEEKAEKGAIIPAGLVNLQNTCYMNATVECFRHMVDLRDEMKKLNGSLGGDTQAVSFSMSFRDMLNAVDSAGQSIPPVMFVAMLRNRFPQFAQQGPQGGYMQQDAEEFYNTLTFMLNGGLASLGQEGQAFRDSFLNLKMEERLVCTESDAEAPIIKIDTVNRLVCNIQGGPGSTTVVNHLHEGLKLGLEGSVEKNSSVLGRNALWTKTQRVSKLPRYLCVQFMRFFWKPTPENRDHTGVKCKILRPVSFTETFDIFDFCTESLQERLKHNRLRKHRREEALLDLKRRKVIQDETGGLSGDASSSAMDVVTDPLADELLKIASGVSDVPPPPPMSDVLKQSDKDYAANLSYALDAELKDVPIPSGITDPIENHFGQGIPEDFVGEYELFGVVTHKGRSADSGHYIGWVRQGPESDYWWRYDDDTVTEVTTPEILNLKGGGDWHTAYLNFYRFKG